MLIGLMEKGMLPDAVIRRGIRRLLRKRLQDEYHGDTEVERQRQSEFFATLRSSPLAVETDAANDQQISGSSAGGCFSWPAPNCSAITMAMSGLSGIICSERFLVVANETDKTGNSFNLTHDHRSNTCHGDRRSPIHGYKS
jgi:hypothetical protein